MTPFLLKHIYSVLSAFTWKPMPPAVCSRQCCRNLAYAGVFARSAISSEKSASVIVSAGYRLLLAFFFFFSVKPFSFIRSIDVQSTESRQIMNSYEANVFPCRTPTANIKDVWVSIRWAKVDFRVTIEHHYGCDSFFGGTTGKKYLLFLSCVNGIKCYFEIELFDI